MSREEKNAAMMALVERFRASGTTQEQFSKNHGVALSVLRYWLAKTRSETEYLRQNYQPPIQSISKLRIFDLQITRNMVFRQTAVTHKIID